MQVGLVFVLVLFATNQVFTDADASMRTLALAVATGGIYPHIPHLSWALVGVPVTGLIFGKAYEILQEA